MIHFQHPQLLYLLLLVPLFIGIYVWVRITRKKRLARFADSNMFERLTPEVSRWRPLAKSAFVLTAFGLLIIALANPQVGSKMVKGERIGSDIAVCFDISNSMMAEDIQPNRLERSKRVIANLMNSLAGDRISLVVFAGSSYIQMPLTNDYSATQLFLDQINCDQISVQGTAIGDAIEKAMETFGYGDPDREWEQNQGRAIIVISDGENFEDDACAAAAKAHEEGIMVCTIGMGLPEGVPIPEYRGGQAVGYKHDVEGNTITTRLNEQMLTDIAHAGQGVYVRGANINAGIHDILKEIEDLEKSNYGEAMFTEYESRYYYPLIAALVLLVAEVMLLERKNRRLNWSKLISREKKATMLLIIVTLGTACMAQNSHNAQVPQNSRKWNTPSVKELRQGNKQYKKGQYEEAEVRYRKALTKDSTYYKSQYNLGNALYKQKRYEEAIPHYQQALEQQQTLSKPMRSKLYHNLGNSHLQNGLNDRQNGMQHFQQAVQSYQNALILDPKNEDTRYNLSYAQKLLQQAQQQNGGNQENQDQQNQQNQDQNQQNQDQNQQNQDQNQQNKDQQNKDQQNKDQQNDNPKDQNKQQRDQQKQQQQKKDQAEQLLKAVENNEKNTMKDQYKKLEVAHPGRIEKDW